MNMRLRFLALPLAAIVLAGCGKSASDSADSSGNVSAAVATSPARQGTLADVVSAYGTAAPALDAQSTLSVHAEGAVTRFDVTAGTAVRRGQRLLTFTLSPAAVAAYQQARTAVALASAQRQHASQLLEHRLATRDQLAQAEKALGDARSTLDALRRQQGDRATVELTAPVDGTVSTIAAAQGELLQPSAPLLSMARGNGLVVTVGIEMDPQNPVKPGDRVTLLPLGSGSTEAGVVKRVAGVLDVHTHLQSADIAPEGTVVAGMGYRADITVGQWAGWLVPRDAMVGDGDGDGDAWHVFQVADGKAVRVPVNLVGESDTVAVVRGALDAKRPLVVVGNTQLKDGMAVRVTAQAESSK